MPLSRRAAKRPSGLGDSGDDEYNGDQFEGRAMWPMTDAGAVLFILTVALLVALAQVAG